jgi:hypothetical protein
MAARSVYLNEVPHTVHRVTVGQLPEFAETVAAGAFAGVPPINRVRARSLAKNPSAAPTDPALYFTRTAAPEEKSLTYLGVMPGRLVIDGAEVEIGWLTTGYGDPAARRTSMVHGVFDGVEADYQTVIATGASKDVAKVYRRRDYRELICHDFVFVPLARVSPRLILEQLVTAARSPAAPLRQGKAVAARLEASVRRRGRLERVQRPSPATLALRVRPDGPHGLWTDAHMAWVLENGWFHADAEPTEVEARYYFHVPGKVVRHHALELATPDGKPRGGAVVSVVEDGGVSAKLLDVFYDSPAARGDVVTAALAVALESGARSLLLRRDMLSGSAFAAWLRLVARPAPQTYFIKTRDPRVVAAIPRLRFATTDCDMAFW